LPFRQAQVGAGRGVRRDNIKNGGEQGNGIIPVVLLGSRYPLLI